MELNHLYFVLFVGIAFFFVMIGVITPLMMKKQKKRNPGLYVNTPVEFSFAESGSVSKFGRGTYTFAQPAPFVRPEPSMEYSNNFAYAPAVSAEPAVEYTASKRNRTTSSSRPRFEVVKTTGVYIPRY